MDRIKNALSKTKKTLNNLSRKKRKGFKISKKKQGISSRNYRVEHLKSSPLLRRPDLHYSRKLYRNHFNSTDYILSVSKHFVDQEILVQEAIFFHLFKPESKTQVAYFFETMDLFDDYISLLKKESNKQRVVEELLKAINVLDKFKKPKFRNRQTLINNIQLVIRFLYKYLEGFLYLNPIKTEEVNEQVLTMVNFILYFEFLNAYYSNTQFIMEDQKIELAIGYTIKRVNSIKRELQLKNNQLSKFNIPLSGLGERRIATPRRRVIPQENENNLLSQFNPTNFPKGTVFNEPNRSRRRTPRKRRRRNR